MKADVTGPPTAKRALMVLYDIFGYSPQILRGADILASSKEEEEGYLVFMPDFYDGNPAPHEIYPDDTPEKARRLEEFINGPGETSKTLERMGRIRGVLGREYAGIKTWGLIGE